jgi:hypothetical protein
VAVRQCVAMRAASALPQRVAVCGSAAVSGWQSAIGSVWKCARQRVAVCAAVLDGVLRCVAVRAVVCVSAAVCGSACTRAVRSAV